MEIEKHPLEERLEEYSRGMLPEEEAERLEEHLLLCAPCQDKLAELDAYVDATRQAAEKVQSEPPTLLEDHLRAVGRFMTAPPFIVVVAAAGLIATVMLAPRMWHGKGAAEPAFAVRLEAVRGGAGLLTQRAPAGRPLLLNLDLAGVPESPSYRLEIVDSGGGVVFGCAVKRQGDGAAMASGGRLGAGRYWVRLYEAPPGRALLREYGLDVH